MVALIQATELRVGRVVVRLLVQVVQVTHLALHQVRAIMAAQDKLTAQVLPLAVVVAVQVLSDCKRPMAVVILVVRAARELLAVLLELR